MRLWTSSGPACPLRPSVAGSTQQAFDRAPCSLSLASFERSVSAASAAFALLPH